MLQLDQATHTYTFDGLVLPSVTQLTSALVDYGRISQGVLDAAADRGRAVHLACHLYDMNDLDESSVDEAVRPYLDAWIRFRAETGFVLAHNGSELQLHHPKLLYAGTLDKFGTLASMNTLIDLKATVAILPAVKVQTAAYAELLNQSFGPGYVQDRRSLQLRPDGTYRLSPAYRDPNDFRTFLALLTVHNWRQRHAA